MMLASLLGTSGPSFIINTGSRHNCAEINDSVPHEDRAIVVGLVGARFQKLGQMDHALTLPAEVPKSKTLPFRQQGPGVTKLFRDFFGAGPQPEHFDVRTYKSRTRFTIETFLMEADDRAAIAWRKALAHIVVVRCRNYVLDEADARLLQGFGLGVWKYLDEQAGWFVDVLADSLLELHLNHVSTVEVAWLTAPAASVKRCRDAGEAVGFNVVFTKRAPFEKLDTGELVVRSWAWDSNSLPGNEFWSGYLDDSDDPAAVCPSTAAELHNPYVNPLEHRIKVLVERKQI